MFDNRATIQEVVSALRDKAVAAVRSMPISDILPDHERARVRIVEEFRLDVPVLNRGGMTGRAEETTVDARHYPNRAVMNRRRPCPIPATAYVFFVPFTGDPNLVRYGTSPFPYLDPVEAEVDLSGSRLVLREVGPDLAGPAAKSNVDTRLNKIEEKLTRVREVATRWNDNDLPTLVQQQVTTRREKALKDRQGFAALGIPEEPSPPAPRDPPRKPARKAAPGETFDAFICHASEDKAEVAEPLYSGLTEQGYRVWYDKAVLKMGDSLRRKIDEGLRLSRFGVVILSPSFFDKHWPQRELDGLAARETSSGEKVVLPVWHKVTRDDVLRYSPPLADKVAANTSRGTEAVMAMIVEVLGAPKFAG